MAVLVLAGIGSAIGGALLPAGISVLGSTITGAAIGQAIGATVGRAIDQSLFGPTQSVTGPRLDGLDVQKSAEGGGLPVVSGRGKVAGQVIWATRLEEITSTTSAGGKGSGGSVKTTTFSYKASFAVALTDCTTGPLRHFGRVWVDGKLLDMTNLTVRFYYGTETQTPDSYMVAIDGVAPAYRGISYVVFEGMPVDDYGRRIPNVTFEVWGQSGKMEDLIQGVDLIPGSTEFGYSPTIVHKNYGSGSTAPDNAFRTGPDSDWKLSLDMLQNTVPNCGTVALVVAWFGTDLRAGYCQIEPRVETRDKSTVGRSWSASGLVRATANLVSQTDGSPNFGSTPDDLSIMDAIKDLKARGLRVVLYPFVMMDVPADNTLPDRDGNTGQAAFPWRGRIGPAAGEGSSEAQISTLIGECAPGDFSHSNGVPAYSGPAEWSYRRFILHLAAIARNAGGVDAFLVGSEFVDLTTARTQAGDYPFVDALTTLAGDVKTMLPGAAISYAADWSEYHSHRNGGTVFFHLDSFWSNANVDFIGIDNYLPIADWRAGQDHADFDPALGYTSAYDLDYLKSNIEGGEYWDWYYADAAARASQTRTTISDTAHGEHWVFRQKAIRDWWSNPHHNRPGGVRDASPTEWTPSAKPVWFTEYGCPAVNLGPNQPNVFFDEKSSESALPYHSSGVRDDFIQRQYIRAMVEFWTDNGGAMLSPSDMLVWAWDSRPWPEFPEQTGQWLDGPNWRRGHWLNARAGGAPAAEIAGRRLSVHYGFTPEKMDLSRCFGQVDGLILPGPVTFREMLAPFETTLHLDAAEIDGVFRISSRAAAIPIAAYVESDLVEVDSRPLYKITDTSREETPRVALVRFSDTNREYQPGAARASIRENPGQAEAVADLAIVSDLDRMTATADMMLRTAAANRATVEFILPPSSKLKPGDLFTLMPRAGSAARYVVNGITRGADRKVQAGLWSGGVFGSVGGPVRSAPAIIRRQSETALPLLMDLPLLPGVIMDDHQGIAAFLSDPWPGGVDLFRSPDEETGYSINFRTGVQAGVGSTNASLPPGAVGQWSGETLEVEMATGAFVSKSKLDVLDGANVIALEHSPGDWEIIQFTTATLIAADTWQLTELLRGQLGTEWTRDPSGLAAGARVVVLDGGISPVPMSPSDIGREYFWRAAPIGKDALTADLVTHTFTGAPRRPYSPVHLSGALSGSDLSITWIRRSRIEADNWPDTGDVPLGEAFERYLVEVTLSGAVVATQTVDDVQSATFDVSGLSGDYVVRVAQISETYGPGTFGNLNVTI